jgi:signal peptidase I
MSTDDDLYIGPTILQPGPKEPNELADHVARWIVVPLILGLIGVVLVFYVFFSSAVVDGESMAPTLSSGDYLLITHGPSGLSRGDVVVAKVMESSGPVELVKRVIGLPGDTVEIRQDVAYVNGVPEPQRGQFTVPQYSVTQGPVTVPPGTVYVLGDNRPISEDSRYIGTVPVAGIKGRAVLVVAPITHVKRI